MKICLVASSGGHLKELGFVKSLEIDGAEYFLITEKVEKITKTYCKVYYVEQINRKEKDVWLKLFRLFRKGYQILRDEEPDYYISTGAMISIPILIWGKLKKKRIIYVESFARVESGSLSGRIAYRFADLFIVYWKSLLKIYPKAVYIDPFGEEE